MRLPVMLAARRRLQQNLTEPATLRKSAQAGH
jgi:hypothetical protein